MPGPGDRFGRIAAREDHRRQGRLQHGRRRPSAPPPPPPRRARRRHRRAGAWRAPRGARLQRRHRLRPARARRRRAAAPGAGAAGGLGRRSGPPLRPLRAPVRRPRAHGRPGAAHQRGLQPPRQLRQRAQHAAPAARLGRGAGGQRERHHGDRRDPLRRQRRARRAGGDHAARRPARAAHRPGRAVHHGPAQARRRRARAPGHRPGQLAALDVGDASRRGAGGMRGKTAAALMAAAADVRTVIANGSRPGVLSAARRRRGRGHAGPRPRHQRLGLQAVAALRQAGAWYP